MKFLKYEMGSGEMGGEMVVKALINFTISGETTLIKPALRVVNKERTSIPAQIPGTDIYVEIKDINVENSSITILTVDKNKPDTQKAGPSETLSVDVTEKPFINVLWLGTILIMLGMITAQVKNYREGKRS